MANYICIHGHFYQPPRENPWLEAIEYQDSAYPYHDWNQRITAECYEPNAVARILDGSGRIDRIVNNYANISFNFGPTLLSWLKAEARETYEKIILTDKLSQERFSGHGSALAQGYNHAILPLCNRRDKLTQIRWGIRDFEFRFGRMPEAMWLPETAVDLETLDLMAKRGLKFAVLAPNQAKRVRKRGERHWRNVPNASIDPSMAYEIVLPSGRRMALFFYDGPISRAVAFEKLLSNGSHFANRLTGAFVADRTWPQLVHIATDGETYGHHQPFGDMALAYALHSIESSNLARLTNYGEFLEKHPATHLVDIWENSSWSCLHGVGRWKENCGCNSGMHPGWHQQWRAPLREALDWLRDCLSGLYDDEAIRLLKDPWEARNDYIDVIQDRSPESVDRFAAKHATRPLSEDERIRMLKLLEVQRHAMLMYTSCGWFFDELSGIETVQVIEYAGRAIQLGHSLFGNDFEARFLELLEKAPSNIPENQNGRVIFEKFVRPAIVDREKVLGHYAVSSMFQDYPERSEIYSYFVDRERYQALNAGREKLGLGLCRVTSKITHESAMLEFGVMYMGDHNVSGGVREHQSDESEEAMRKEMTEAFSRADLPEVVRLVDKHFGKSVFSLRSLFRDEQRRVLDIILKATNSDIETLHRQAFEKTAPLMRFLMDLGLELPPVFRSDATAVINARLRHAFEESEPNPDRIRELLDMAKFWHVELDSAGLGYVLRETIEKNAEAVFNHNGDPSSLQNLAGIVRLASGLPFKVNFYRTQNIYHDALKTVYPKLRESGEKGDQDARTWVEQFKELGSMLSFKVE